MFNDNDSACSYGIGIGVIAFLACVVMLVIDANFPQISNANQRKIIVLGDLVFSGEFHFSRTVQNSGSLTANEQLCVNVFRCGTAAWTLLWFICFCVLANQWAQTSAKFAGSHDAARAVIAFSFFSIITWVRPNVSLTSSGFIETTRRANLNQ